MIKMIKDYAIATGLVSTSLIAQVTPTEPGVNLVEVAQLGAVGVLSAIVVYLIFKYIPGRDAEMQKSFKEKDAILMEYVANKDRESAIIQREQRADFIVGLAEIANKLSDKCDGRHEKLTDILDTLKHSPGDS